MKGKLTREVMAMKMMSFFLAGIVVCSLALAPCIYAANEQMGEMGKELQAEAQQQQSLQSVDRLLGKSIMNETGQNLGTVSDVIICTQTGQVAYVIVSTGGVMGLVVPFKALTVEPTGQFTLNMNLEQFKQAPARQQNLADRQWGRQVHEFYGVAPFWEKGGMRHQTQPMQEPSAREEVSADCL
jgi:sporulation protein YlmC with PRC-barrel domain